MNHYKQPFSASMHPTAGGVALVSSYDRRFIEEFKMTVPANARRWDRENKQWIISQQYAQPVADLCQALFGVIVQAPSILPPVDVKTELLKVEYLGTCKPRGGDISSAYGYVGGEWYAVFPETILMEWFSVGEAPDRKPTLYGVLGVNRIATNTQIKQAFRRLAKQWHPDVCREPDATAQFQAINDAYQILSEPMSRARYDAGLAFEATMDTQYKLGVQGYRSPLRCGYILAEGTHELGRLNVSKILQWEDILNERGETMVVSWPFGADTFLVNWI